MKKKILLTCFLISSNLTMLFSQDIMLQGWYWDYPKTANGKWWVDTIAQKTKVLHDAGFNYIWLPPMSKTSSGSISNGYDVKDYFDLGISPTSTQFGNETRIHSLVDSLNKYNIVPIADMVYNHRNGGLWEKNTAVEGWIENYNLTKHNSGDACYPSDRFRCTLPIGGNTGLGTGTYYFKVHSASASTDYYSKPYTFRINTKKITTSNLGDLTESEPNGGGDCSELNNFYQLGRDMNATIDNGGCGTDEFALTISSTDYFSAADTMYITITNVDGNYSDHFIYGLWYAGNNSDIQSSVQYQTATDFTEMKSTRGDMNYLDFKPNGNPTCLCGDWDAMLFYYDMDHTVSSAADTLNAWTKWMMQNFGMQGLRIDAVKNFTPEYTGNLLDYLHYAGYDPKMVVGESYDFDAATLNTRLNDVYSYMDTETKNSINYSLFDFNLQSCLRDACDAFGNDVRNVFNCGMHSSNGTYRKNIVTFVNNHDFREASQSVDNDPILAYAYIITNPVVGIPCIYWSDYYNSDHPTYTSEMNALLSAHYDFIQGAQDVEYLSRIGSPYSATYSSGGASTSLIYQLSNTSNTCLPNRDVVVAINFSENPLKVDIEVNTSAPYHLQQGDTLVDVLGKSNFDYAIVNSSNQIYIDLPARSYSVWARVSTIKEAPVIVAQGAVTFCNGGSVKLNTTETKPCYTYQWKRNAVAINGATSNELIATESGSYVCEASYNGAMPHASSAIVVTVNPGTPEITTDGFMLNSSIGAATYQWYFGSAINNLAIIPGATAQTYIPVQGGYYAVQITDANGCSDQSD
ncbi:MAG: hypothetical protein LH473_12120, partial [Chitinophagales bacterium]|nr:hypothetical protein [Chitinophagales bacterium]